MRKAFDKNRLRKITNSIIILQKKEVGKEDSFWYDGEIAKLGNCILIATGEIRVTFPDGQVFRDYNAVAEAESRGYKDKDLSKLEWSNNNWFEVISDKGESILSDVRGNYDEGIELLEQYFQEDVYKK